MDDQLNKLTAQFASREMEAAFKRATFIGDRKNNFRALFLAIPIFAGYALLDYSMLGDPDASVQYRLWSCLVAASVLLLFKNKPLSRYQELLTCVIPMVLSTTLFFILFTQGGVDHNYYVGLIQGGVFICFLLRVGFVYATSVLLFYLVGFTLSLSAHLNSDEVRAQIFILFSMFLICAFGNYLLQRYRRGDFLKSQTIKVQNEKLAVLLMNAEQDNERKIAALNTLVHFVKTPLHQINGFSDILVNSHAENNQSRSGEFYESAKYIKTATANLTRSVNNLLTYYRLDELGQNLRADSIDVDHLVEEFTEMANGHFSVDVVPSGLNVDGSREALKAALVSLAEYYRDIDCEFGAVKVSSSQEAGAIRLIFEDDVPPISPDEFVEKTKPLTKIDNYLTIDGAKMPMLLRTAVRAVEVAGGTFDHEATETGNRFTISIPDHAQSTAAA